MNEVPDSPKPMSAPADMSSSGALDACAISAIAAPRINACFPPLTWQTYDADFTEPRFDHNGTLMKHAEITVRLNGAIVHENQELPKTAFDAPVKDITTDPGPLCIRHKDYPVYYRNIWILPK